MTDAQAFLLETSGNRLIISLLPHLNKVAWADIDSIGAEVLSRLNAYPSPKVLIDLCQLDYMGSAQVALMVRVYKAVKEKSGTMVVANRHPVVQEVLTLAGLNKLWTILGSREEGLRSLGGDPGRSAASQAATPANSNAGTLVLVALVAAVIGSVCLFAAITQAPWLPTPAAGWVALASAAIALGLAATATLHALGLKKIVGTAVLLYGIGLLLGSVFAIATPARSQMVVSPAPETDAAPVVAPGDSPAAPPEVEKPQTATPVDDIVPAKS